MFIHTFFLYMGGAERVKLTVPSVFFVEREFLGIVRNTEFLQQNLDQLRMCITNTTIVVLMAMISTIIITIIIIIIYHY